jgi:putative MATE family efflux protein
LIWRLGLPSIISMLAVSLYNLVDTFWVAKLGYQAVAAITITLPFFWIGAAIANGTGIGLGALISRRFGEKNVESANHATGQTIFLSLAIGIVLLLFSSFFPHQILILFGATPDILSFAEPYLRVIGWGMPVLLFSMISRNIFQASGDAVRPMVFIIIAEICNAILAPCLIFGWGFFPEMGMAGAGLATVIANFVAAALAFRYILAGKTAYRIKYHHCVPDKKVIGQIYRVGLPSMLMQTTESIVFIILNHLVAGFGSLALAAIGIAIRIGDLIFLPVLGVSSGILPIIGYSLGARFWTRLWSTVKKASWGLVLTLAAATVVVEIFPGSILGLFNQDPELLALAVPGMRLFFSSLIIVGPTIVFITTFQGLSKGKEAMWLSLARQFIFLVPGLYVLSYFWGLTGIWIAMPVSDLLGFIAAAVWIYREYNLQKKDPAWGEQTTAASVPKTQSSSF